MPAKNPAKKKRHTPKRPPDGNTRPPERKHDQNKSAKRPPATRNFPQGMEIIYEDRDIIVIEKPAGLLSMGCDGGRERTAYYVLTDYVRKGNPKSRNRVFIVHRLDRDTSGLLVFAKSEEVQRKLQDNWPQTGKEYLAVVHGRLEQESGTVSSYLAENRAQVVYSTDDRREGKLSHTEYRLLKAKGDYSLLLIDLLTGRKNQIRVHMADIGHPVVGDDKYGEIFRGCRCKRLALHAWSLSFPHPYNGRPMRFHTGMPAFVGALVGHCRLPETGDSPTEDEEQAQQSG